MASISHNVDSEFLESKSKWFKSLSMEDRMQIFCEYTDMAFALNPNIAEKRDAQSIDYRTYSSASKSMMYITFTESWRAKQIFNYNGLKFYILSKNI